MRTENVLETRATDTIGPLRIRLLGAASAHQPVVIRQDGEDSADLFHVLTVAEVLAALAGRTAGTTLADALDLASRTPVGAVSLRTATDADVGRPVVENGRLLGVVAGEVVRAESTEDEMGRSMPPPAGGPGPTGDVDASPEAGPKRRWGFLSRNGGRAGR